MMGDFTFEENKGNIHKKVIVKCVHLRLDQLKSSYTLFKYYRSYCFNHVIAINLTFKHKRKIMPYFHKNGLTLSIVTGFTYVLYANYYLTYLLTELDY